MWGIIMYRKQMGKIEYIFKNAIWVLISMVCYKNYLFRCLPGLSLKNSELAMWALVILFTSSGILLTLPRRRCRMSVVINILLPYEIYSVLAYGSEMSTLAAVSIGASLLLAFIYNFVYILHASGDRSQNERIFREKVKLTFLGSVATFSICMLIFFIPLSATALFGNTAVFKKQRRKFRMHHTNVR